MNTGNLQLEGLYLAIGALIDLLVRNGVVSGEDVDTALAGAEQIASSDPHLEDISPANREAVLFLIRLLRLANNSSSGDGTVPFSELARMVGELKDLGRPDVQEN